MPGGGIPIGAPRPGGIPIGGPIGGRMPGGGPIMPVGGAKWTHAEAKPNNVEPPAAPDVDGGVYLGVGLLCPLEAELLVQVDTALELQRCWRRWPLRRLSLCPVGS